MNDKEFINELKKINVNLTSEQMKKFIIYRKELINWNKKFNLTSVINPKDINLKHFYDSLYLITTKKIINNCKICDIGTGAGFPGIPLAILDSSLHIDLLESNGKKCMFLNYIKTKLNLNNINIINKRVEDYMIYNLNTYDLVISRAVAHLYVLSFLGLPLLKSGGYFLSMKGNIRNEVIISQNNIQQLHGNIKQILQYQLPFEKSNRSIIIIKKVSNLEHSELKKYNQIIKEYKKVEKKEKIL